MTVLVDTNILLRWIDFSSPEHEMATASVTTLRERGVPMYVAAQNLIEFWAVATRPRIANGFGMPPEIADNDVTKILDFFPLVPEPPLIFEEWRKLVVQCAVSGRQVHDARLAALMRGNGISHVLTFDTHDFERYPGVTPIHPSRLPSYPAS